MNTHEKSFGSPICLHFLNAGAWDTTAAAPRKLDITSSYLQCIYSPVAKITVSGQRRATFRPTKPGNNVSPGHIVWTSKYVLVAILEILSPAHLFVQNKTGITPRKLFSWILAASFASTYQCSERRWKARTRLKHEVIVDICLNIGVYRVHLGKFTDELYS